MKNLTDTQKKWALTACLSAILSFNMVVALSSTQYSVTDLASHEEEQEEIAKKKTSTSTKYEEMDTEDGLLEVRFSKIGKETYVTIPKKIQSGFCYEQTCGSKNFVLPESFDSDIKELKKALRKKMAAASKQVEAKDDDDTDLDVVRKRTPRVADRREKDEDVEDSDDMHPDLVALQDRCDNKEDESRMHCFANGLTSLLSKEKYEYVNGKRKKKKKIITYNKNEVMEIYKEEIERPLIKALTSINDEQTVRDGQDILADMMGSVSKNYGYLRERLSTVAANSVALSYQDAQNQMKRAQTTTNPYLAKSMMDNGFMKLNMAHQLAGSLDQTVVAGLDAAYSNQTLTAEQAVLTYDNYYARIVQPIIQGMRNQPLAYVISTNNLVDVNGALNLNGNNGLNIVNVSSGPVGQSRSLGNGIMLHSNGLTSNNVMPNSAPMIVNNGQAGTASIQVIPLNQVPGISSTTFPAGQNAHILPQNALPAGGQFAPVPTGSRGRGL